MTNLISKLIENLKLEEEITGQLLQAIWRSFDSLLHHGLEMADFPVSFYFLMQGH
jgi:hypothetical protein